LISLSHLIKAFLADDGVTLAQIIEVKTYRVLKQAILNPELETVTLRISATTNKL